MARWAFCFVMLFVAASVGLCRAADPLYSPPCGQTSNYTANSTFQRNLDTLFRSLSSNASINGFTSATAGDAPNQVYGLVQCRGDASPADCANCTSDATTQIVQRCPNDKSSMIWFDKCFLRYSYQSFIGTEDFWVRLFMWNLYQASNATLFNSQLGNLMRNLSTTATTDSSSRLFAAGETNFNDFQKIYGLVQCTRDLSNDRCSNCLTEAIGKIPTCCDGKQGGRVLTPSCIIRYETYSFFNASTVNQSSQSPTPPAGQPSDSNSPPPSNAWTTGSTSKNKSSRTIVIVISILTPSALIFLCVLAAFLCIKKSKRRKLVVAQSHRDHDEDIGSKESFIFDLSRIKAATNNFSQENKLGEGGYGPVYRGELPDGQEIAVKRLSSGSGQGAIEFKNEVKLVAKLEHRNLVRLLGCCFEGNEKILVYEYVPNGPNRSLDYFLFDQTKRAQLDWLTRLKIINGIARGLLYLHEDSRLKIIHRDLKAGNILLDKDMNPKISDFGMAKLVGLDETQGNTSRIAGTYGYMSSEYAMHGQFSVQSDVFSFGVLMLEIVSGQKVSSFSQSHSGQELLSYTWKLWTENRAIELLDETLIGSCQVREVERCIHVGLLCVQEDPVLRPTMSAVVLMLSTSSFTLVAPSTPAFFMGRSRMGSGSFSTGSSVETTKLEASKGGSIAQSISSAEFPMLDAR